MAKLSGEYVRILVGGYDLTGDSNQIAITDARDMYDVTTFGAGVRSFIGGQRSGMIEHAGYLNAATAHSHLVLNGMAVEGLVSVLLGQNADPVVGDPVYSLFARQGRYATAPAVGTFIPFAARFANRGLLGGWGVLLTPPVDFTNSVVGTTVDNVAASPKGGVAHLHVLTAAATDRYTFVVKGATDSSFTQNVETLGTFTLDGSTLGSERIAISGSIPAYTRWEATRTGSAGDTVRAAVSLVRF
jgi:hypothetical protein